jgi:hypothetical protein
LERPTVFTAVDLSEKTPFYVDKTTYCTIKIIMLQSRSRVFLLICEVIAHKGSKLPGTLLMHEKKISHEKFCFS